MTGRSGPAAIVFDLDGVLVDTEPLKLRAHRAAVEERGGELGEDLYRTWMGGPHDEVVRAFLEASGLAADDAAVADYEATFRTAYRELLTTDLAPAEGAEALLSACRDEGRRLALVTSSDPWMVEIVLPRLGGRELFEAVVTAGDVEREKPAPDPYLKALEALGDRAPGGTRRALDDDPKGRAPSAASERSRPVALEDTRAGVASARAAGLPVVAVRHAFNTEHAFDEADAVVPSLASAVDLLDLIDRLAARSGPARR